MTHLTTISPLRRRMIEDMTVRGFSAGTQRAYIGVVAAFTGFLGRAPDQADAEDWRRGKRLTTTAANDNSTGYRIEGNISSKGSRIYHMSNRW